MTRPITLLEREVMDHALGRTYPNKARDYRNHFAARPGSEDYEVWERLEVDQLAQRGRTIPGGLVYFQVTEAGKQALVARPPVPCFLCRILRSHEGGCMEVARG